MIKKIGLKYRAKSFFNKIGKFRQGGFIVLYVEK